MESKGRKKMQSVYINDYHLNVLTKEEIRTAKKGQLFYYSGYLFIVEKILCDIDKIFARQVETEKNQFFLLENRLFGFFLNYDVEEACCQRDYFYYVQKINEVT